VSGASPRARLQAALAAVGGGDRAIGVGWATVDLKRAAAELAADLGIGPDDFVDAPPSVALGAHCRVAVGVVAAGEVTVVILEPATEGRLAGRLARHDEGPVAVWLAGADEATRVPRADPTAGPFGPEALLPSVPDRRDLLRFIVALPPGTIPT
jgi:hypothetical protein